MSSSDGSTAASDSAEIADSFLLAVIVGECLLILRVEEGKVCGQEDDEYVEC